MPFSRLVKESEDLAQLRREYASSSDNERRHAADFQYNASIASQMFNKAVGQADDENAPWPGAVTALAIDPKYAPALLTVGSFEYLYGRIDEAMAHFLALTTLPEATEDIVEIVDQAGDFLIDNQDYENAVILYSAASGEHPNIPQYRNGLSYCFGKLGRLEEAIEQARYTVNLKPDSHEYLTDLGWSLVEAEYFDEAQTVLKRAVAMSPPDYELARENLAELHRRMRGSPNKQSTSDQNLETKKCT